MFLYFVLFRLLLNNTKSTNRTLLDNYDETFCEHYTADLVTFTEETLMENFIFLCSGVSPYTRVDDQMSTPSHLSVFRYSMHGYS